MGKKLIVNADDFGQSAGVNKGIIKTFEDGILTSASLMVRYLHAGEAAEYANKNNLDLGLHVDLGEWILIHQNWETVYEVVPLEDAKAVREEVEKQLNEFVKLTGKNPSHINSHQHVHTRKTLQPVFIDIAQRLNVTLRKYSDKVKYCGEFYGQYSGNLPNHEAISVENLKRIITKLPDGITELACHPGINIEFDTMYKKERDMEVKSLCSKEIRQAILDYGIELCPFTHITF